MMGVEVQVSKGAMMDEKMYTVQEIAKHFRISRQSVYDWIKDGKLRAIRIGERVRVPESALREFVRPITPGEPVEESEVWVPTPAAA
jgi:putative molybdopterin biosynthesis protein